MSINDEHIWKIFETYYKNIGLVSNQIESYNDFITFGLQEIVDQESTIVTPQYIVNFGHITLEKPQVIEEDRTVKKIFPMDARRRDINYDTAIYCDITETFLDGVKKEQKTHNRVTIGRMPVMLRSNICNLNVTTLDEQILQGECPNDPGGYFIIKGNERVLVAQMRSIYNHVFVLEQKPGEKYKYIAEVRSMSTETGHSILIKAMLGVDDRTICFSLPYIKKPVPAGVVFKSLGFLTDEEIIAFIGLDDERANKYMRYIIRDSFFCSSKEQACKYIGESSLHMIEKGKEESYAQQVVETELLPHLGVSSSPKEHACFLGHMIRKLLATSIGIRSQDDKDNYSNKRVEVAGVLLYDIFRNLFKKLTLFIKLQVEKKKQRPDILSIISRNNDITKKLHTCMASGNWIVQKNASYMRTGVSQVLDRMTYGATLSHLRRILIPVGKEGKNTAMRQIHSSQFGFVCPCECFDPLTRILMWDGTIKAAKDIKIGDLLIDDNGNSARVKSTCSGYSDMYTIVHDDVQFDDYTVTSNHILTLMPVPYKTIHMNVIWCFNGSKMDYDILKFNTSQEAEAAFKNIKVKAVDISIENYNRLPVAIKRLLKMFKVESVKWDKKEVKENPYVAGKNINDTDTRDYIINSVEVRTSFLRGILESENYSDWDNHEYVYVGMNKQTVIFLARSLGIMISKISERCVVIPKNFVSRQKKSNFNLVKKPIQGFVGWQLEGNGEGNGRFLLHDMTVTHNTPEGGKIGVVLNFALTAKASRKIPTLSVRRMIEDCKTITLVKDMDIKLIKNYCTVFLNNITIGFTQDSDATLEEISHMRNIGLIDKEVSFTFDFIDNDIKVFCDEGRFMRPLFTLTNNQLNVQPQEKYKWKSLIKKGMIQYIDACEIENNVIAMNQKMLKIQQNNYCEIHPCAMLGIMAIMIPFSDHSQSPRNCYQCLSVDEEVIMANLSKKKISNIQVGDEIITVNPKTCEQSITKIINQYVRSTEKQMMKLKTITGREIICTYDHPILTEKGWKKCADIKEEELVCVCYVGNSQINDEYNLLEKKMSYKEWSSRVIMKNKSIFVPVDSIVPYENVMIADITTESECHSFITGNGICVHNSSMGKQALGIPVLSYNMRADTMLHVLHYPQKPLVYTKPAEIFGMNEMPSGINAIVAIACYSGFNQEDSVMLNLSSVQKGLFCLTSYHKIACSEKKRDTYSCEEICLPPLSSDSNIKEGQKGFFKRKNANYGLLDENGIVRTRTLKGEAVYVKKGDVLIGKIVVTNNKNGEELKTDSSVVVDTGEEGIIDRTIVTITPAGYKLVKVVIRVYRSPTLGDKLASRSAQKGTIGMMYRQEDMPFTSSGIFPDIIISPNCVPSRMTINQLIECALGKECTFTGSYADATPFTENSENVADKLVERMAETMKGYGLHHQGSETMYNGMTGEMMEAKIFIGPTYYQRLKHMVVDKMHVRAKGLVTTLTRQPLEGRAKDGGLRFGEMERDCMIAHGASRFLKERLFDVSDPFQVSLCKKCGIMTSGLRECQSCKGDDVKSCNFAYASKLLTQELSATGLKIRMYPED